MKEVTAINIIIKSLNIKEEDIEFPIDIVPTNDGESYIITLKKKAHICPKCGSLVDRTKDYKIREIKHKVFEKYHTIIYYRARRLICNNCKKTFMENNTFGNQKRRLSASIIDSILKDLKPYNSTFSSVARKFDISVTTVIDIFDKHVQIDRKSLT